MTNITLHAHLIPTDDREVLAMLFQALHDSADYLRDTAEHNLRTLRGETAYTITNFDYSGDEDDYSPAAMGVIRALTEPLFQAPPATAREALDTLLADQEFCEDLLTIDFSTRLATLVEYADED